MIAGGGVGELGHWNDCYALLPAFCGSGGRPLLLRVEHAAGFGCGSGDAQAVGTTAGSIRELEKLKIDGCRYPQAVVVVEISIILGSIEKNGNSSGFKFQVALNARVFEATPMFGTDFADER